MERATRIELASMGWKPTAQPLYQTRSPSTLGDRGPSRTGWTKFWRLHRYHYLTAKKSGAKDSSRPLTTPTPPFDGRAEFNTWGERRGSNPLRQFHRLTANLFAFAHHNFSAVYEHTPRERRKLTGAAGQIRTGIAALQGRKSAIDVRRLKLEPSSGIEPDHRPYQSRVQPTTLRRPIWR